MTASTRRTLMLMRHAKSAWPDVPDHDRPLAPRGERDAPAMGRWLRAVDRIPDYVLCSTARRASQTWLLAQAELGAAASVSFDDSVYFDSTDPLAELLRRTPATIRTLLLVGHDPAVHELALLFAGDGSDPGARERLAAKFPTAAVAILDFDGDWAQLEPGTARLISFMVPRDL
jgi:phosphohistidine phosphatase